MQSTPKQTVGNISIDWSSDAGYTPPPRRKSIAPHAGPTSTERPRLQDLDTKTLEPIFGDYEEGFRLPSPTPRKVRSKGKGKSRPSDFLIEEEEDGDEILGDAPEDAPEEDMEVKRILERPPGGKPFLVGGEEFMIWSDGGSQEQQEDEETTPKAKDRRLDDSIFRSPISSPRTSSPGRKRKSSPPAVAEEEEVQVQTKKQRTTRSTVQKEKEKEKGKEKEEEDKITTDSLVALLPKRRTKKTAKKKQEVPNIPEDSEEEGEGDEDDLTARRAPTVKSGRMAGKAPAKTMSKTASKAPVGKGKGVRNTYTRKGKEREESPEEEEDEEMQEEKSSIRLEGLQKLKEMRRKFEEVDKWELEFETVSED